MCVIRRAMLEDVTGIARVHVASWRESYRGIVPDDFLNNLSLDRRIAQWNESLSNSQDQYHRVFVADVNGEISGFAGYGRERDADPIYLGELYAIYILKSAQQKGIGRRLVSVVASDLIAQGITSMLVWVLADNPARGFYERLGGLYLREKPIEIGGRNLIEVAYGWKDIYPLAEADG
jgi:ribosomal protein S18 acetylase RimI-like enzyme